MNNPFTPCPVYVKVAGLQKQQLNATTNAFVHTLPSLLSSKIIPKLFSITINCATGWGVLLPELCLNPRKVSKRVASLFV